MEAREFVLAVVGDDDEIGEKLNCSMALFDYDRYLLVHVLLRTTRAKSYGQS